MRTFTAGRRRKRCGRVEKASSSTSHSPRDSEEFIKPVWRKQKDHLVLLFSSVSGRPVDDYVREHS